MDISEWDIEFKESTVSMQRAAEGQMREPSSTIQDRVNWQNGFDTQVRRLLQDFEFSDSPGCRLNHLERMHHWFQHHGAKTARKAQLFPGFITFDRNSSPVPGSAMHLRSDRSTPATPRSTFSPRSTF